MVYQEVTRVRLGQYTWYTTGRPELIPVLAKDLVT